jgi:predicted transcriptional regulator
MVQRLASAELAVMNLLWEKDWMTARQLRELPYRDAGKAQHGIVQRLLKRLEDKGHVERDRGSARPILRYLGRHTDFKRRAWVAVTSRSSK